MPRPMGRPQNKVKYPGKLLMRLINYIFRDYKVHCIAVFILIFVGVYRKCAGNDVYKRSDRQIYYTVSAV